MHVSVYECMFHYLGLFTDQQPALIKSEWQLNSLLKTWQILKFFPHWCLLKMKPAHFFFMGLYYSISVYRTIPIFLQHEIKPNRLFGESQKVPPYPFSMQKLAPIKQTSGLQSVNARRECSKEMEKDAICIKCIVAVESFLNRICRKNSSRK